jgi:inosine/guanosine/xanthosine phosphorylase family protein
LTAAADHIRAAAGDAFVTPCLGLVLGSGLGGLADSVEDATAIPYKDLPGFPVGSVAGHAGRLVLGTLEGTPVVVLQGRAHLYEGIPASDLAVPTRTVRALGAETIVLTNAAGSLNPAAGPGDLMALTDHINLMGANPLAGPNDDELGPRFVGLGDAYDVDLRAQLHAAAQAEGVELHEGVYLAVAGPSFETPAEIRAFKVLGADAVGMSTVPEVIVARHCGLKVAAVSAITNLAEGLGTEVLSHEHTLDNAARAAEKLQRVLRRFVRELGA